MGRHFLGPAIFAAFALTPHTHTSLNSGFNKPIPQLQTENEALLSNKFYIPNAIKKDMDKIRQIKKVPTFLQKRPSLSPSAPRLNQRISIKLENPHGFNIQERTNSGTWIDIGSSTVIERKYLTEKLPNERSRAVSKTYRITSHLHRNQPQFIHESIHDGSINFYSQQEFIVTAGGSRSDNSIYGRPSYSNGNVTARTISPTPLKRQSLLGQGQIFDNNLYTTPSIKTSLCPYTMGNGAINVSYIPYFSGWINGKAANGNRRDYLFTPPESLLQRSPVQQQQAWISKVEEWCYRNFHGRSGFISETLTLDEMRRSIVQPSSIIKSSRTALIPGLTLDEGMSLNPTNHYAAYIFDENNGSYLRITEYNINELQTVFTIPSRKFMLIRHIEANSTNKLKTELFDYGRHIDLVNEAYFSITATSGGGRWDLEYPVNLNGSERLIESFDFNPDGNLDGATIENSPVRFTASDFNIYRGNSERLDFNIFGRIYGDSIEGELNINWWNDHDYLVTSSIWDINLNLAIINENGTVRIDSDGRNYIDSITGFNFRTPNTPFTGTLTQLITQTVKTALRIKINSMIKTNIVDELKSYEYAIPEIPRILNFNILEDFVGINSDIISSIDLDLQERKAHIHYTYKLLFFTPEAMGNIVNSLRKEI